MMKSIIGTLMFVLTAFICFYARADSVAYYFQYSNELIDMCYPGDTFYAGISLQCAEANHLDLRLNPFSAPGEYDCIGNYINSPLVAGSNFGVQKFAMDSTLISSREDFDNFMSLYDIMMPERWECQYNGQVSEFGHFEFVDSGTGGTRQDPLIVSIVPKAGAILTGYEFDTALAFVEQNAAGYYFATHIADFTTDPAFWDNGSVNPNSAYFAVGECLNGDMPIIIPEPAFMIVIGTGIAAIIIKKKQ
jgi:hypothetical protein